MDGRIGDGEAEHVDHHERRPLLRRQDPQRGVDAEPGIHRARGVGVLRYQGLEGLLIAGRDNRADDRPRRRVALRSQFARAGMPVGYSAPSLMVLMRGVASRRRNSARRR